MKIIKSSVFLFALLLSAQTVAASGVGDRDDALSMFKSYVNAMVQKVEKAKDPAEKRAIINRSFDKLTTAFEQAQNFGLVSEKDKKAIHLFKTDIQQKKNELNGKEGYRRVANNNLNNFANYVQQDLEQADTVNITISATLLVLIIILLLLL